jgi:hypothetical protein
MIHFTNSFAASCLCNQLSLKLYTGFKPSSNKFEIFVLHSGSHKNQQNLIADWA